MYVLAPTVGPYLDIVYPWLLSCAEKPDPCGDLSLIDYSVGLAWGKLRRYK
jgi:hypothetical protein